MPAVDEAALAAAFAADKVLAAARQAGAQRWSDFLAVVPDQLRDARVAELRAVALRARAAYGPKDSIRELLPSDVTEPFLDALDRLRRTLLREMS